MASSDHQAQQQRTTPPVSSSLIDLTVEDNINASVKKSFSSSDVSDIHGQDFLDSNLLGTPMSESMSNTIRISPEKTITLPSLTEAQLRAITGKSMSACFPYCFWWNVY